jgi:hypothetical protein
VGPSLALAAQLAEPLAAAVAAVAAAVAAAAQRATEPQGAVAPAGVVEASASQCWLWHGTAERPLEPLVAEEAVVAGGPLELLAAAPGDPEAPKAPGAGQAPGQHL